jgi:hypothetical protein
LGIIVTGTLPVHMLSMGGGRRIAVPERRTSIIGQHV